ncbi:hypothetical protein E2562_031021 [Oryza meyeriana var. granulata]|uniref:Uncharacterized protein n=1 Tax=Oryza meyeriana var. granulata TaxID=110450 RepID=A0A6G1ERG8_9ORYZ|nr:hypothetical protein E2562_031021 [Oryza meyeriana var. granulata]
MRHVSLGESSVSPSRHEVGPAFLTSFASAPACLPPAPCVSEEGSRAVAWALSFEDPVEDLPREALMEPIASPKLARSSVVVPGEQKAGNLDAKEKQGAVVGGPWPDVRIASPLTVYYRSRELLGRARNGPRSPARQVVDGSAQDVAAPAIQAPEASLVGPVLGGELDGPTLGEATLDGQVSGVAVLHGPAAMVSPSAVSSTPPAGLSSAVQSPSLSLPMTSSQSTAAAAAARLADLAIPF